MDDICCTVTISDDDKALQAAYAAGGAVIGIWRRDSGQEKDFSCCLYLVTDEKEADEEMLVQAARRRLGLPWRIGETKRLLIREFKKEDPLERPENAEEAGRIGKPAYGDSRIFRDAVLRAAYIDNQYRFYQCGLWALVEKESGRIIGKAGITEGELGYHIYPEFRRKGFAFEACEKICIYGKEKMGLSRIFLRTGKENSASIALAVRLGFSPMKTEQGAGFFFYEKYF